MSALGKQFKIIGHDFDPDGGTPKPSSAASDVYKRQLLNQ